MTQPDKPREWTIVIDPTRKPGDQIRVSFIHCDNLTVEPGQKIALIEKSAFDELLAERDELSADLDRSNRWQDEQANHAQRFLEQRDLLLADRDRLREALEEVAREHSHHSASSLAMLAQDALAESRALDERMGGGK